ncbi:MAG: hypothetical protein KatS3mg104_0761 [Phycisphaerae bacterium]|nr:MAG: hypothetical protein KatS3mg104_0761 [Phycisphaerae bacterium]
MWQNALLGPSFTGKRFGFGFLASLYRPRNPHLTIRVQAWRAYLDGESGLIHAPTGSGKTLAVIGGPVIECHTESTSRTGPCSRNHSDPFRIIWITPMRALATDTAHAISELARNLDLSWSVEVRSSDTP